MRTTSAIMGVVAFIVGVLLLSFLFSYPLMLLWNGCLVPAVSVLSEVSWLQMWGITVLIGILFKNTSVSHKE
jgi:hypothetical protein